MVESLLTTDSQLLDNDDDLFIKKPQKKHKILMLSDHPLSTSGVGVQARLLIDGLLKTGKYSFRCLGGAIRHEDYRTMVVNEDFIVKPVDGFGTKEMIRQFLVAEKPDAIFLFTDPRQFIWIWEMEDEIHQICPIVYWHVWDNDPYPAFNKPWYESTDLINCLSKKTYNLVKEHFPEKTNYIPHAFPKELYHPISDELVVKEKLANFGDKSTWFKALWVNRNATRKVPSDVMEAWKLFLGKLEAKHGHRNAALVMHTDPNDFEGPNLLAVAELLGLQDHVWFSTEKLDFQKMNLLHNMVDCQVNISKAEGFGLSSLISLQVGKPTVLLCTGGETDKAIDPRDGSENGVALKPSKRQLVGSQMVPYIYEDFADINEVADAFMKLYEMTDEEKSSMSQKCLEFVDYAFDYNHMVNEWERTMSNCIETFKAQKADGTYQDWTLDPIVVNHFIGAKQVGTSEATSAIVPAPFAVVDGPQESIKDVKVTKLERKNKNNK
jgi:hypothetical protein